MTLKQVDQLLIESSGRYDLTPDDRLSLLNRACRALDSKVQQRWSEARAIGQLGVGNNRIEVADLRALKDVWLHSSDGKLQCLLLNDFAEFRQISGYVDLQSALQEEAGLVSPLPSILGRVYCLPMPSRPASSSFSDTTIVARVNLTNRTLTLAASPPSPTELSILIEDGLLAPLNPALDITVGTLTITGTDIDDAVLVEEIDCSCGVGTYKTSGVFKTLVSIVTASFDHLLTGDEKITVKTGRAAWFEDLDLSEAYNATMLLFFPTLTVPVTVEVFGDFWSRTLTSPTDTNFWTVNQPDALIAMVQKKLEGSNRNRSGLADFDAVISEAVFDINRDFIWNYEMSASRTLTG